MTVGFAGRAALALAAIGAVFALAAPVLAQENGPIKVLAATVRTHGHECTEPQGATRDGEAVADQAVWILRCKNASYRVRLSPNRNAVVERVQ